MDINENLLQINSFTGGMNTDMSDAMMNHEQYRFAKNLRLVTNTDSNTGELHIIEGTESSGCIKIYHQLHIKEILAATTIRQYGIIIAEDSNTEWSIYRFTEEDDSSLLLFGPCKTPIRENGSFPCIIARYESANNIKLYIADGIHDIMVLNVANAPQNGSDAPTDIKYLVGYANTILPPMSAAISRTASGMLNPAKVQYSYRLYNTGSAATRLAPLSNVVSIYRDAKSGYSAELKTKSAIELTIPNLTQYGLSYIQIFRITYRENGSAPDIKLVIDLKYSPPENNGIYTIIDTGTNDISELSTSQFIQYMSLGVIPKIIESKTDYLFAGNVKYKQQKVNEEFDDVFKNVKDYFKIELGLSDDTYYISYNKLADNYLDQHTAFRPGETYRLGIILYDKDGNYTSVIPYDDIEIDSYSKLYYTTTKGDNETQHPFIEVIQPELGKALTPYYSVKCPTLKVSLSKEINDCSRYEVVRCIRTLADKRTISQGIAGRPLELKINTPKDDKLHLESLGLMCPSGFMSLDDFNILYYGEPVSGDTYAEYGRCESVGNIIQFASPEIVYLQDDMESLLLQYSSGLKLNRVANCEVFGTYPTPPSQNPFTNRPINGTVTYTIPNTIISSISAQKTNPLPILKVDEGVGPNPLTVTNIECFDILTLLSPYNGTYATVTQGASDYDSTGGPVDYNIGVSGLRSGRVVFNYMFPSGLSFAKSEEIGLSDFANVKSVDYDSFSVDGLIRFMDDVTSIGGMSYVNWTAGLAIYAALENRTALLFIYKGDHIDQKHWSAESDWDLGHIAWSADEDNVNKYIAYRCGTYPIGGGGKCALFTLPDKKTVGDNSYNRVLPAINIVDLVKEAVPYGGDTEASRENSVYYSFGSNYQANIIGKSHELMGDCYIGLFNYIAAHTWYDTIYPHVNQMGTLYSVPIMSDIDIRALFGYWFDPTVPKQYNIQEEPVSFRGYSQDKGAYLYNTAYNAHTDTVGHVVDSEKTKLLLDYDTRIHYSLQKTNGELIDNWTQFMAADFLDVDSRYGLITDMRLFKNRLMFWQEDATGVLAVNERVVISNASDTQVSLGTGSVLERFDYVTTLYGMKAEQFCDTQTNKALYWWDEDNREILQYTDGYSTTPLASTYGVKNYINSNLPNNRPKLLFDNKYNEVICQCVNNEALVFNEDILRFISVYTTSNSDMRFTPMWIMTFGKDQYVFNKSMLYKYNVSSETGNSTLFGKNTIPEIQYVINSKNMHTKTYDTQVIGGRFYDDEYHNNGSLSRLDALNLEYKTPLGQHGNINNGEGITNVEYDYRVSIPRDNDSQEYGGRLRGKTMRCRLWSTSNSIDFSIQYIMTKYRISWT